MHRSEQIIEAAAAAITAQTDVSAAVFTHRELSLSELDQEIPALCVRYGSDSPLSDLGAVNFAFIDSLLEMRVMAYAVGSDEVEVMQEISRLRSVVHRALLGTDRTLGLAFVIDTRYGGTERPEFGTTTSPIGAMQDFMFFVHYRMSVTTPE